MNALKTYFGYNRLNIRYKQCFKCITRSTNCRETHREELRGKQEYHYENKVELINKKMEYNKVYQNEKIECNIRGKTITRKSMFKHKNWPACKAIANVRKYQIETLDDERKQGIYSLGKTKLKINNVW